MTANHEPADGPSRHATGHDPLTRGATEVKAVLDQVAALLDAEWKRLRHTIDTSEVVPSPVRAAVDRLDDLVDTARRARCGLGRPDWPIRPDWPLRPDWPIRPGSGHRRAADRAGSSDGAEPTDTDTDTDPTDTGPGESP